MTSPPRGPVPHPQGRGSGGRVVLAEERLNRIARRDAGVLAESAHADQQAQSVADPPQRRHPSLRSADEEALRAALAAAGTSRSAVRYRGFVLLPQADLGWLVRPERSPMAVLPFRTPPISLSDVKALVDWRLDGASPTSRLQPRM